MQCCAICTSNKFLLELSNKFQLELERSKCVPIKLTNKIQSKCHTSKFHWSKICLEIYWNVPIKAPNRSDQKSDHIRSNQIRSDRPNQISDQIRSRPDQIRWIKSNFRSNLSFEMKVLSYVVSHDFLFYYPNITFYWHLKKDNIAFL